MCAGLLQVVSLHARQAETAQQRLRFCGRVFPKRSEPIAACVAFGLVLLLKSSLRSPHVTLHPNAPPLVADPLVSRFDPDWPRAASTSGTRSCRRKASGRGMEPVRRL
eukprot:scaffold109_cov252-Pinguiococcus_pyrenoidosus.AAC.80